MKLSLYLISALALTGALQAQNQLRIITNSLPDGEVGSPYAQRLRARGGTTPYSWSIAADELPAGLSLDSETGVISGTPSTAGVSSFTVRVRSFLSVESAVRAFTITVAPDPPMVQGSSILPEGEIGIRYSHTLRAEGGTPPYRWFLISGETLPPGLNLTSGGVLRGIPTSLVTNHIFGVEVRDSAGQSDTRAFIFSSIAGLPQITSTSPLPDAVVGVRYSMTLQVEGGLPPYSWTPVGVGQLSLGTDGVFSGTPTGTGSFAFLATVQDSLGGEASKSFSVEAVAAPLVITTTALPDAEFEEPYSQTLEAVGGVTPYEWRLTSGALPSGMSLSGGGVISGRPGSAGSHEFTVQVIDAESARTVRRLRIEVAEKPNPPPQITTSTLPDGTVGRPYSQGIRASGGSPPYSWRTLSRGGALSIEIAGGAPLSHQARNGLPPPGLALSNAGVLSGVPEMAGTTTFEVEVIDSNEELASAELTIRINEADDPTITTNALSDGEVGAPYSQSIAATGGAPPYTWSLESGSLPDGLTLSPGGVISGTPSVAETGAFTVRVTDSSGGQDTKALSLSINDVDAPQITTPSPLPEGEVGAAYSQALQATGGSGPYSWSLVSGTLPAGLALSAAGAISGTPTSPENQTFTVRVTDSNGEQDTKALSLTVNAPEAPTITTGALPDGEVGVPYSQSLAATGGSPPNAWSLASGNLPDGLALSGDGVIRGTPTSPENQTFTVRVTDSTGEQDTQVFSLTVIDAGDAPQITTPGPLPDGEVGAAYSQALEATGGSAPYAWSLVMGALPDGLTLSPQGLISGNPPAAQSQTFTVRVTDASGGTADKAFSLSVNDAGAPEITTQDPLPDGAVGLPYLHVLEASGGALPYAWSLLAGSLPDGLTLSTDGTISGEPTSEQPAVRFTVRITDGVGATASRAFSITIVGGMPLLTGVSAASFVLDAPLAPESIASVFALGLANETEVATTLPLPTLLAGTSLKVVDTDGVERMAQLFFVSPEQVNFLISEETAQGPALLEARIDDLVVAEGSVEIGYISPGLFSANGDGQGAAAAIALRVRADGSRSEQFVFDAAPLGSRTAIAIDLGPEGEQVFLLLFGTGIRGFQSEVTATVGGLETPVLGAVPQGEFVGLDQVNIGPLPRELAGRGEVEIVLIVDGVEANRVTVSFE